MRNLLIAMALFACVPAWAQVVANPRLAQMLVEDQADRKPAVGDIDWSVVGPRDDARLAETVRLLRAGEVRTAADYHAAAMIFQHGQSVEDIQMAHALASVGRAIDPNHGALKWLSAAAWDRVLMRRGKPQWYGTQYTRNEATKRFELYVVDESAVTDKERVALGVPTLAEAKAREALFNR